MWPPGDGSSPASWPLAASPAGTVLLSLRLELSDLESACEHASPVPPPCIAWVRLSIAGEGLHARSGTRTAPNALATTPNVAGLISRAHPKIRPSSHSGLTNQGGMRAGSVWHRYCTKDGGRGWLATRLPPT